MLRRHRVIDERRKDSLFCKAALLVPVSLISSMMVFVIVHGTVPRLPIETCVESGASTGETLLANLVFR